MISVLFYAAIKSTVPLFVCTPLNEQRYFNPATNVWEAAVIEGTSEVHDYLDADLKERCEGHRFWVAFSFASLTVICLILGPILAMFQIQYYMASHEKNHHAEMRKLHR